MADLNTNSRETNPASENAVSFGWDKYLAASSIYGAFRVELEAAGFPLDKLTTFALRLLDKPTQADIDRLVAYAKEVLKASEPMKLAADKAAFEAKEASLAKLADRVTGTLERLERVSEKLDGAAELMAKLVNLQHDMAEGKADADKGFRLCGYVDGQITDHKMATVERVATGKNRSWLLDREGQTGRHANAYRKSGLPQKFEAWLSRKPAANAHYQDKKAWLKDGWELVEAIEYVFGRCSGSVCEGKGALTPGRDGQPQHKCRKCFQAQSGTVKIREPKIDGMSELREGAVNDPEAFTGVTINGQSPLSAQTFQVQADEVVKKPKGKRLSRAQREAQERE